MTFTWGEASKSLCSQWSTYITGVTFHTIINSYLHNIQPIFIFIELMSQPQCQFNAISWHVIHRKLNVINRKSMKPFRTPATAMNDSSEWIIFHKIWLDISKISCYIILLHISTLSQHSAPLCSISPHLWQISFHLDIFFCMWLFLCIFVF